MWACCTLARVGKSVYANQSVIDRTWVPNFVFDVLILQKQIHRVVELERKESLSNAG